MEEGEIDDDDAPPTPAPPPQPAQGYQQRPTFFRHATSSDVTMQDKPLKKPRVLWEPKPQFSAPLKEAPRRAPLFPPPPPPPPSSSRDTFREAPRPLLAGPLLPPTQSSASPYQRFPAPRTYSADYAPPREHPPQRAYSAPLDAPPVRGWDPRRPAGAAPSIPTHAALQLQTARRPRSAPRLPSAARPPLQRLLSDPVQQQPPQQLPMFRQRPEFMRKPEFRGGPPRGGPRGNEVFSFVERFQYQYEGQQRREAQYPPLLSPQQLIPPQQQLLQQRSIPPSRFFNKQPLVPRRPLTVPRKPLLPPVPQLCKLCESRLDKFGKCAFCPDSVPAWQKSVIELNQLILEQLRHDELAMNVERARIEFENAETKCFQTWTRSLRDETKRLLLARRIAKTDEQLLEMQRARDRLLLRG